MPLIWVSDVAAGAQPRPNAENPPCQAHTPIVHVAIAARSAAISLWRRWLRRGVSSGRAASDFAFAVERRWVRPRSCLRWFDSVTVGAMLALSTTRVGIRDGFGVRWVRNRRHRESDDRASAIPSFNQYDAVMIGHDIGDDCEAQP